MFAWGGPGEELSGQLHAGLGKTDSWDDSIPDGCVKPPAGPVSNGGIPFAADLDCFDGLFNFNQVRPAVFDGGYGFGRVAGQADLPVLIGNTGKGTYIVEAVAPPGYLHQGNGDQNVAFGDTLQASTAALPFECVGMELPVPEFLTLFPGESNPNYAPGKTWRKCDMKAVPLAPGANPAADFYMYHRSTGHCARRGLHPGRHGQRIQPIRPHLRREVRSAAPAGVGAGLDRPRTHPRVFGPVRLVQLPDTVELHHQPAVSVGRHAQHDRLVHEPPGPDRRYAAVPF